MQVERKNWRPGCRMGEGTKSQRKDKEVNSRKGRKLKLKKGKKTRTGTKSREK